MDAYLTARREAMRNGEWFGPEARPRLDEIGLTEIAQVLGRSRQSARTYVREGLIEGARFTLVGGRQMWLAPRSCVERFRDSGYFSSAASAAGVRSKIEGRPSVEARVVDAVNNAGAFFAGDSSKATSKRLSARGQPASTEQIASGEKYWHGGLTDAAKADYPEGMSPADIEFMRHGRQDVDVLPQHDLDNRLGHCTRSLSPITPEDAAALVRTINSVGVSHPHLRIASPTLFAKLSAHGSEVLNLGR